MKKYYLLALTFMMVSVAAAQVINFLDPAFKARLLNTTYPAARDIDNNYVFF